MTLSEDLEKEARQNGALYAEIESGTELPSLDKFEKICMGNRDELAYSLGMAPEDVHVIGVKVFFLISDKRGVNSRTLGAAVRVKVGEYARLVAKADMAHIAAMCERMEEKG
jgi:hypothetical protein